MQLFTTQVSHLVFPKNSWEACERKSNMKIWELLTDWGTAVLPTSHHGSLLLRLDLWIQRQDRCPLFQNHWHMGMSHKPIQLKIGGMSLLVQVSLFLYRKGIKNYFMNASSVCESDYYLQNHGKMKGVLTMRLIYLGNCSVQDYTCMRISHFPGLLASCWRFCHFVLQVNKFGPILSNSYTAWQLFAKH